MPNSHRHLHGRRLFKVEKFLDDANVPRDVDSHQHEDREAVVKTVYKTLEPTFEGEVAGYTTVNKSGDKPTPARKEDPQTTSKQETTSKQDPKTTTAPKTAPAPKTIVTTTSPKATPSTSKNSNDDDKDNDRAQSSPTTTSDKTSSIPTVIRVPTESASLESVLAIASDDRALPTTLARPTEAMTSPAHANATPTTGTSTSKSTEGSSPGAKAGIAFGVIGGLFLVGLLVFLVFNRRRKRAEHERLAKDDEKLNGPIGGGFSPVGPASGAAMLADKVSVKTDPRAPRVSLRPVTQFFANWGGEDKSAAKGAGIALTTPAATSQSVTTSRAPGGSAWDRPTTSQSIDPANPFGSQAERVPSPIQEESSMLSQNSIPNEKAPVNDPLTANGPPVAAAAVGAAAGAGAAAAMTRKASMRRNGPHELDLTIPTIQLDPVPASPAGTEFSVSSMNPGSADTPSAGAAAIAAAGGPANSAVYRVQLDFVPTLEDELGLKTGDLVRLLHEYDDGWALVIRLDRSRQGVAPRTCLSTRPIKPRPVQNAPRPGPPVKPAGPPVKPAGPSRGPPNGPLQHAGQRPMNAQGRPASPAGRPMTPNGTRSQSPMGRPMSPAMRSQSPGPRSQSPGPRPGPPGGRPMSPGPRSQSPGPRNGPPGGRPQSPNGMNRRNSPPGPSPMNPAQAPRPGPPTEPPAGPPTGPVGRKPVPGQAY